MYYRLYASAECPACRQVVPVTIDCTEGQTNGSMRVVDRVLREHCCPACRTDWPDRTTITDDALDTLSHEAA